MVISRNLVDLIERHADELASRWLHLVREHPGTPSYAKHDPQELYDSAYRVYSQLGKWISRETSREDIARYYTALGARRRAEGFCCSELIQALMIIRRVLWFKVLEDGLLDTALDFNLAINLNNQVLIFFDRAIYYMLRGYEEAII